MLVKGSDISKDTIRTILLIQLGDIGDVVWATPTFRAVKESYPEARVSVLVREGAGSLLEVDPHLNKIFEVRQYKGTVIERAKAQYRFIRDLRKERFDLAIDLRSDDRGAYMALLSGAPVRASMIYRSISWRNHFFTHLAEPPANKVRIPGAAEQSLRIVREFGIGTSNTVPRLYVSPEAMRKASMLRGKSRLGGENRWITMNPFSRWSYKEWASDKWSEIINWLRDEHGYVSVLVGSESEKTRADEIINQCKGAAVSIAGATNLGELAGFLSLSRLHLGVDSAAPHIAAAVGTPTITLYGPTDWHDWAPQGEMHRVIVSAKACAPCHQKGCHNSGRSECLEEMDVSTVMTAISVHMSTQGE